ncbi:uncharacterized protein PHALS_12892 [Plasmopara halstedii]|uniref:Uncharacterized protein n=1 Tax=Plasmopara halstedii TaxID=4781 RepID=A0A0P1AN46_PLAHL|nr:uncharacterized protein PHALS_12892 [Plasmopara halstedii]CEG42633.1 hypothetical protein PHALS_12892 [Plasmopara halstedii]|eukprot:XP_024579002.1 hypothetical protein PHALS_12892 [Plasmopara halstedii]
MLPNGVMCSSTRAFIIPRKQQQFGPEQGSFRWVSWLVYLFRVCLIISELYGDADYSRSSRITSAMAEYMARSLAV